MSELESEPDLAVGADDNVETISTYKRQAWVEQVLEPGDPVFLDYLNRAYRQPQLKLELLDHAKKLVELVGMLHQQLVDTHEALRSAIETSIVGVNGPRGDRG